MSAKFEIPNTLLCVDPGLTSGIALVSPTNLEVPIIWSNETQPMETCDLINQVMHAYGNDPADRLRVICESFVITPQTGKNSQAPYSLEIIGVLKWLADRYKNVDLVFQTPQKAKMFCPNERLKRVGYWHVGGAGHARDALRHGVTHLVDCGWDHPKILV